jgi:DNA-binding NarL/FixJ family response regulator
VEQIRIVLVDMPGLLRDIVRAAASDGRLKVVREYAQAVELLEAVERNDARVVVAGAAASDLDDVGRLLRAHPEVKVLAIRDDGSDTTLWELKPYEKRLGEVSPEALRAAIHGAVDADSGWVGRS